MKKVPHEQPTSYPWSLWALGAGADLKPVRAPHPATALSYASGNRDLRNIHHFWKGRGRGREWGNGKRGRERRRKREKEREREKERKKERVEDCGIDCDGRQRRPNVAPTREPASSSPTKDRPDIPVGFSACFGLHSVMLQRLFANAKHVFMR